MAFPAGRAVRSYGTGLRRGPVSAAIPNAKEIQTLCKFVLQFFYIIAMKKIVNDTEHATVMARIGSLMAKGSDHVSKEELAEIRSLALVVQDYEQTKYAIDIGRFDELRYTNG